VIPTVDTARTMGTSHQGPKSHVVERRMSTFSVPRDSGMDIRDFSRVDASGQSERLIASLETTERIPQVVDIRSRSYALLHAGPGERMVDVGCGAGKAVAELLERGVYATGVDSSEDMIAYASSRFPGADFRCASAEALPFADNSLVGYRAERVYSHIKNPDPAIAEANRVLVPGGRFVVVDVENDLWAIDADDRGLTRTMVRAFADSVANPWIGRASRALLLDNGFEDVVVELHSLVLTAYSKVVEQCAKAAMSTGAATQEQTDAWVAEQRCRADQDRFFASIPLFIVSARRQ
jgi:ubiquinone/menaquinone biosynthesis C-methylase UbiE